MAIFSPKVLLGLAIIILGIALMPVSAGRLMLKCKHETECFPNPDSGIYKIQNFSLTISDTCTYGLEGQGWSDMLMDPKAHAWCTSPFPDNILTEMPSAIDLVKRFGGGKKYCCIDPRSSYYSQY